MISPGQLWALRMDTKRFARDVLLNTEVQIINEKLTDLSKLSPADQRSAIVAYIAECRTEAAQAKNQTDALAQAMKYEPKGPRYQFDAAKLDFLAVSAGQTPPFDTLAMLKSAGMSYSSGKFELSKEFIYFGAAGAWKPILPVTDPKQLDKAESLAKSGFFDLKPS